MSDLIGAAVWAQYSDIIRDAHDTFSQGIVTWKRSLGGIDKHGEDNKTERFDLIQLEGLMDFNDIRKWPINVPTSTGELDRQTTVLILNIRYLGENNWLTINGNFDHSQTADRFIHNGITYRSTGDTDISQAHDEDLLFMMVLKREETATGDKLP